MSHSTSRSFFFVPTPFNSNNRKRTVNVLEVHSATQNQCVPQCTRANDSEIPHVARCSSQVPFSNQSPVPFLRPRVARTEWCRPLISNYVRAPRTSRLPCAPKPIVVAVPSGPRYRRNLVAVEGRTLRSSPSCARPAVGPSWAPCSLALPSLAGCSSGLPSTRVGRRRGKVRACRSSSQSSKRSACNRCRLFAVL